MDRRLDSLAPEFRPYAVELLARLTEAGILVLIVNTRRSATEQAECVRRGVSWVEHSRHEDGCAIDVAPYELFEIYGGKKVAWNPTYPVWQRIGEIGERCTLRWGGHWKKADLGHFELPGPAVRNV